MIGARFGVVVLVGTALALCGCSAASADNTDEKQAGAFACTVASITDGDTFRCSELGDDGRQIRVRLSGVAARERDGSCSPGHPCSAASAEAATAELRRLALGHPLTCPEVGSTYARVSLFFERSACLALSFLMSSTRPA